MEIREADRGEIETLAAAREFVGADFPSSESLRRLWQSPHVLMPVAVVGSEIVGFGVAKVITHRRGRLGAVRYLASLVGEGPVDRAIKGALLSRLEQKFKSFEAGEIELLADQPPERLHSLAPGRRFVKLLTPAFRPAARMAAPGRAGEGVVE